MITIENLDVIDWRVETAEDCSYLAQTPAATTLDVYMTMKEKPSAEDTMATLPDYHANINNVPTLTFVDGGGGNDSVVRDKGSWLELDFRAGQVLTIAGTTSNNGSFTILSVTDDIIEVATASFTAETTNSYTATAAIPDTDYVLLRTVAANTGEHHVFEMSGTGLRFVRATGTGTIKVWVKT